MVKLLLTVRRLANTWGGVWTAWEENKEAGERVRERDRKREREEGGWDGKVKVTEVIIPICKAFTEM